MVCVQASLDVEGGAGVGSSLGGFLLGALLGVVGELVLQGRRLGALGPHCCLAPWQLKCLPSRLSLRRWASCLQPAPT